MAYLVFGLSLVAVFAALATLLHLQFGLTGIANFGVAGFWGLGMYAAAVLMIRYELGYITAAVLATALVALVALALGWVILDLDVESVLVATLAFATVIGYLVVTEDWLTEGVVGLGTVPYPIDVGRSTRQVALGLVAMIVIGLLVYADRVHRGPYGRLLLGIADNESLARSLGKRTRRQKLMLFTVTSAAMGAVGVLSGSIYQFLVPELLDAGVTFTVWIALVLGGRKRVLGGIVGVLATVALFDIVVDSYLPLPRSWSAQLPSIKLMLYGLVLILVIMFRPLGLLGDRPRGRAVTATSDADQPHDGADADQPTPVKTGTTEDG